MRNRRSRSMNWRNRSSNPPRSWLGARRRLAERRHKPCEILPFLLPVLAGAVSTEAAQPAGLGAAVRELFVGAGVGVGAGLVGGWLLTRAVAAGWSAAGFRPLVALGLALLAYGLALHWNGNGFVAAFLAGMSFGSVVRVGLEEVVLFAERVGGFLALMVWLIFGAVMVVPGFRAAQWQDYVFAVLALTVLRMVPVALSLAVAVMNSPTRSEFVKAALNEAPPLRSEVTSADPRNTWPCPKPDGSQLTLAKNSRCAVVALPELAMEPWISTPLLEQTAEVSTGKFWKLFGPEGKTPKAWFEVTPSAPRSMPSTALEKIEFPKIALSTALLTTVTPLLPLNAMMLPSPDDVPPIRLVEASARVPSIRTPDWLLPKLFVPVASVRTLLCPKDHVNSVDATLLQV